MAEESEENEQRVTKPGEWERKPADKEDLRHDDDTPPLPKPRDDADEDLAEEEAGEAGEQGEDEGFDRPDPPDEAGIEDTGDSLERHGTPLLEGPEVKTPVGSVPTRSLAAMGAFVLVFCVAFLVFWAALGDFGILLGILAGSALGLGAMKLLADRAA